MATVDAPDLAARRNQSRSEMSALVWMLARRLLAGLATLWVCSVLVFLACNVLPGDVATVVLGKNATPERVSLVRQMLDLDESLVERYISWVTGFVQGDFGQSSTAVIQGGDPSIARQFLPAFGNSLTLALATTLVLVPLSIGLGVVSGVRAGKLTDIATSATALFVGSLPEFVFGAVVTMVFFQWLGWLPPISLLAPGEAAWAHPDILVLPVLTLLGVTVAGAARQVRAGVVDVSREDYVGVAKLNGLPRHRVLFSYTLRNALAPSIQVLAQAIQYLVGGIIIVEGVFNYPGVGEYLVNAVATRDIPVVQTVAIVLAALYILINIVADLLVILLVPSLRTSR